MIYFQKRNGNKKADQLFESQFTSFRYVFSNNFILKYRHIPSSEILAVTELGRIQITQPICRKFFLLFCLPSFSKFWHDPKVIRHLSVIWEEHHAVKFNIFSNWKAKTMLWPQMMRSFLANVLFHESKNNFSSWWVCIKMC